MASVASLESELKKLGGQSKRHSPQLVEASEASLTILGNVIKSGLDEKETIRELRNYSNFVSPFILACSESSAKSCASALQCIQTLATYSGIAPSRLNDLLVALLEATQLGLGIQLKILQVLPVILVEFSSDLSGPLIINLLSVCTALLGSNKVAMVHNTAYATLQQLINGIFDRTDLPGDEGQDLQEIVIDEAGTQKFMVKPHLYDSAMILIDLCNMTEGIKPSFSSISGLSLTFTMELLELTLSNQAPLFYKYNELATILRVRMVPLLLRLFSEASEFPIVLRTTRIFYLLLRQHLNILATESEVILSTITQCASSNILWKRSLCLEVLQGLFSEVGLLIDIYTIFDKESHRTNVINTIVADFSKALASKDLQEYQHKFMEKNDSEQLLLSKGSSLSVPIIEMLDRVEPPKIDIFYSYYQILKCINLLADDIHKLATNDIKAKQLLEDTALSLHECYKAAYGILMNMDLFRLVVRAVQRLAHAAGIVALKDTRDKFMLLLAEHSTLPQDANTKNAKLEENGDMMRCSLCVRALFNLGYALGNQLNDSWYIITDTIASLNKQIVHTDAVSVDNLFGNYDEVYSTINIAMRKLIESSIKLNDQALISFIVAIGSENDPIKYEILRNICVINEERVANPDLSVWEVFSGIMVKGIETDSVNSDAVSVLTDVSSWIVNYITSVSEDPTTIDKTLAMVIQSLCEVIMKCENNNVKESSFQHLNAILEKFGQYISAGWESVFEVVSSIPKMCNLELIRCAFTTLELICSDFLDNLPNGCIFSLTLCLDEFSKQVVDLNTSFTSVSLFWSVCDHLMSESQTLSDTELDVKNINSEDDLVYLARLHEKEPNAMVLWLLAVIKLSKIAGKVDQHQVRTSAIQIFLRIFNTHGPKLSQEAWDVAHRIAFHKLLLSSQDTDQKDNNGGLDIEVPMLVIEGIFRIDLIFLPKFYDLDSFKEFWIKWIDFLDSSAKISPRVAALAYKNLKLVLESKNANLVSSSSIYEFWKRQSPRPSYSKISPKPTADALKDLVSIYPLLREHSQDYEAELELICQCALFPYYTISLPAANENIYSLSALQKTCTDVLEHFDVKGNAVVKFLLHLNDLANAPYNEKVTDVDNAKPDFTGLSKWAQQTIIGLLPSSLDDKIEFDVDKVSSPIISTMNVIIRECQSIQEATEIILKILTLSTDSNVHHGPALVDSVSTVLQVTDSNSGQPNTQVYIAINFIQSLIKQIKSKPIEPENWKQILNSLLEFSVFYETSIHNMRYYSVDDEDLAQALLFGSADIPKPIHNTDMARFCLSLLCELSHDNNETYSKTAMSYFKKRVIAVLFQYIGNCTLLGQEPIREIFKLELLGVLSELEKYSNTPQYMDENMRKILLDAIACSHIEFQACLHKILQKSLAAK